MEWWWLNGAVADKDDGDVMRSGYGDRICVPESECVDVVESRAAACLCCCPVSCRVMGIERRRDVGCWGVGARMCLVTSTPCMSCGCRVAAV